MNDRPDPEQRALLHDTGHHTHCVQWSKDAPINWTNCPFAWAGVRVSQAVLPTP